MVDGPKGVRHARLHGRCHANAPLLLDEVVVHRVGLDGVFKLTIPSFVTSRRVHDRLGELV